MRAAIGGIIIDCGRRRHHQQHMMMAPPVVADHWVGPQHRCLPDSFSFDLCNLGLGPRSKLLSREDRGADQADGRSSSRRDPAHWLLVYSRMSSSTEYGRRNAPSSCPDMSRSNASYFGLKSQSPVDVPDELVGKSSPACTTDKKPSSSAPRGSRTGRAAPNASVP